MLNNSTPATQGSRKISIKTTSAGLVKRDINLISTKDTQEKIARRGLFIIAFIVAAAGFVYFAILMPLMQLDALTLKLQDVNKQLLAYEKTEAEFTDSTKKIQALKQLIAAVDNSDTGVKEAYDLTKMIEKACPETIDLSTIAYNINEVKLGGFATVDKDVAQLLVNLQSYTEFSSVMITRVSNILPQQVSLNKKRSFEIVAYFPPAVTAAPLATPVPAATNSNGGSGK